MKIAGILLALLGLTLVSGCGGGDAAPVLVRQRVLLALDPTVGDSATVEKAIEAAATRLREDSELVVWHVTNAALATSIPKSYGIKFDANRRIAKLEADRQHIAATVIEDFRSAWRLVHADAAQKTTPRSCLLTTLYQVSQYLKDNEGEAQWTNELIVASDLLEACSDWGKPVNLERALTETTSVLTDDAAKSISLAGISGVLVLRLPNPIVDTPSEATHLRSLWDAAITKLGASGVRVIDDVAALRRDDDEA